MWQVNDTRAENVQSKHIFVGETRIATKINSATNENTATERVRTYYYHSDHLGSAQTVTNWQGNIHERLEYTPYGETWIDWRNTGESSDKTPFRFTAKERDEETGLYYFGARYLDARTSRWLSVDPAMYEGDYFPVAPNSDEARRHNQNLPGMGGIYNYVNFHVYHYGGNNPVKYIDPDGRVFWKFPVIAGAILKIKGGVACTAKVATPVVAATAPLITRNAAAVQRLTPVLGQVPVVVEHVVAHYQQQASNVSQDSGKTRGTTVIGPRDTYVSFAQNIGANYLNPENWTREKNIAFIQDVIRRGDDVIFAGQFEPTRLQGGSILEMEIQMLTDSGYNWSADYTKLIKEQ